MTATVIKQGDNTYNLKVTPVNGVSMTFTLSKNELNSLLIDAKNILKVENTFLNNLVEE